MAEFDMMSALASTASAKNQMAFQERMSNTAHQREVADLKAAGLNPVLSAHSSGASTPNGAEGDYSDVLPLLSQSLATNAEAVSRIGKSLEEVIKAGLPSEERLSGLLKLRDVFSNYGSADNAREELGNLLFGNFDDNEYIPIPGFGKVKVSSLKNKLNWFVADGIGQLLTSAKDSLKVKNNKKKSSKANIADIHAFGAK